MTYYSSNSSRSIVTDPGTGGSRRKCEQCHPALDDAINGHPSTSTETSSLPPPLHAEATRPPWSNPLPPKTNELMTNLVNLLQQQSIRPKYIEENQEKIPNGNRHLDRGSSAEPTPWYFCIHQWRRLLSGASSPQRRWKTSKWFS